MGPQGGHVLEHLPLWRGWENWAGSGFGAPNSRLSAWQGGNQEEIPGGLQKRKDWRRWIASGTKELKEKHLPYEGGAEVGEVQRNCKSSIIGDFQNLFTFLKTWPSWPCIKQEIKLNDLQRSLITSFVPIFLLQSSQENLSWFPLKHATVLTSYALLPVWLKQGSEWNPWHL